MCSTTTFGRRRNLLLLLNKNTSIHTPSSCVFSLSFSLSLIHSFIPLILCLFSLSLYLFFLFLFILYRLAGVKTPNNETLEECERCLFWNKKRPGEGATIELVIPFFQSKTKKIVVSEERATTGKISKNGKKAKKLISLRSLRTMETHTYVHTSTHTHTWRAKNQKGGVGTHEKIFSKKFLFSCYIEVNGCVCMYMYMCVCGNELSTTNPDSLTRRSERLAQDESQKMVCSAPILNFNWHIFCCFCPFFQEGPSGS